MNILIIILSIVFIAAGFTKVAGMNFQKTEFRHWNLPTWMLYLTGSLEIITGICLLSESTCYFGAVLGSIIMLGAIVICWVSSENRRSIVPIIVLNLCAILMWQLAPESTSTWIVYCLITFSLLIAAILWFYTPTPMNKAGDQEFLDGKVMVTHQFTEALGVNYHYITTGNPENPMVVIIPGCPESWYCFHYQIAALSEKYYVLALDMKPYGQTGKDLDGNHTYAHIANEVKSLLDTLDIKKFHLIGHDRGSVVADHLLSKKDVSQRVISYARMQQSFNEPHGDPVPPHHLMASFGGTLAFKIRFGMWYLYAKSIYIKLPIAKDVIQRIEREFKFKNIAQALPLSFKTTNFDEEKKDREDFIFGYMTMPILILQGRFDPGQHPEEYEKSHTIVPNLRVQFIEAGHFFHLEAPKEANEAILTFFAENDLSNKGGDNI